MRRILKLSFPGRRSRQSQSRTRQQQPQQPRTQKYQFQPYMTALALFLSMFLLRTTAATTDSDSSSLSSLSSVVLFGSRNGYDAGGADPVCWTSLLHALDNNDTATTTTTTSYYSSSSIDWLNHALLMEAMDAANSSSTSSSSSPQQVLRMLPDCFNGTELTVTSVVQQQEDKDLGQPQQQQDQRQILYTGMPYTFRVQMALNVNNTAPTTLSLQSNSSTVMIHVRLILCNAFEQGFCNPLSTDLIDYDLAIVTNDTTADDNENKYKYEQGQTLLLESVQEAQNRVAISRWVQWTLEELETGTDTDTDHHGSTVDITVQLPANSKGQQQQPQQQGLQPGPYYLVAHVVAAFPLIVRDTTDSNNATSLLFYQRLDIANAIPNYVVQVQGPPKVMQLSQTVKIGLYVVIAIVATFTMGLLGFVVFYRHHLVLRLAQSSFIVALVLACLICVVFTFTVVPGHSDFTCRTSNLTTLLPLTVMAAILTARIWRVYLTLSAALHAFSSATSNHNKKKKQKPKTSTTPPSSLPRLFRRNKTPNPDPSRPSPSASFTMKNTNTPNTQPSPSSQQRIHRIFDCIGNLCSGCRMSDWIVPILTFLAYTPVRIIRMPSSALSLSSSSLRRSGTKSSSSSSSKPSFRSAVGPKETLALTIMLTLPQLVWQLFAVIYYPASVVTITKGNPITVSQQVCNDQQDFAWVFQAGLIYVGVLFVLALAVAYIARDLPSAFHEKDQIFHSAIYGAISSFITLILYLLLVTNQAAAATQPEISLLLKAFNTIGISQAVLFHVVWPKIKRILSGEQVVLSNVLKAQHHSTLESSINSTNSATKTTTNANTARISGLEPSPHQQQDDSISQRQKEHENCVAAMMLIRKDGPCPMKIEQQLMGLHILLQTVTRQFGEGRALSCSDWKNLRADVTQLKGQLDLVELAWHDDTDHDNNEEEEDDDEKIIETLDQEEDHDEEALHENRA